MNSQQLQASAIILRPVSFREPGAITSFPRSTSYRREYGNRLAQMESHRLGAVLRHRYSSDRDVEQRSGSLANTARSSERSFAARTASKTFSNCLWASYQLLRSLETLFARFGQEKLLGAAGSCSRFGPNA